MPEYQYSSPKEQSHIHSLAAYGIIIGDTQYEGKKELSHVCRLASWSILSENDWLVEAYYLRISLRLSYIPHYTALQKFAARINGTILAKIISSFILLLSYINRLFIGIDSSWFKVTNASHYYTDKAKLRNKYLKLSLSADLLSQIICTLKIRRAPSRHDNIDFQHLIIRTSEVLPISVVVADKGYDSEGNHVLAREQLHAFSVIPTRFEYIPIWRTYGKYRKQMKCGYPKLLYHQRNKEKT